MSEIIKKHNFDRIDINDFVDHELSKNLSKIPLTDTLLKESFDIKVAHYGKLLVFPLKFYHSFFYVEMFVITVLLLKFQEKLTLLIWQ
ncbi:MAG: hypothetical protein CM15mP104_2380 [Gammaproteobacteria bacterium]|nr:MAG: hypothetical protein CM15mP104_2380 [Gammaproteobacteria bacterium]